MAVAGASSGMDRAPAMGLAADAAGVVGLDWMTFHQAQTTTHTVVCLV